VTPAQQNLAEARASLGRVPRALAEIILPLHEETVMPSEQDLKLAKERLTQAQAREDAAHCERREAELALLELQGEGESRQARFIRAYLADNSAEIQRLAVEGEAEFRIAYPEYVAKREAEYAAAAARLRAEKGE
jgi:hypothetical protein